jgi:hypothetical protein
MTNTKPIVTMITATTGRPTSQRRISASTAAPTAAHASMASGMDSQNGTDHVSWKL